MQRRRSYPIALVARALIALVARALIALVAAPMPQIRAISGMGADRTHDSDPMRAWRPYDQQDHNAGRSVTWRR